ncbi:MAG: aldehyde dehydrogenase [Bdellovibrionaceae bacterium]|nr:aldehyde dehydrogenase [Pseudobdellovibrionaceae bacterium]
MQRIPNFIGGQFSESKTGRWLENYEPATGKVYSLVTRSGPEDADEAVQAAAKAFPSWCELSSKKRSDYLRDIAKVILEKLDLLAQAEAQDTGKPLWLARELDIPRAANNFSFFAEEILRWKPQFFPSSPDIVNYVKFTPIGPVVCISPWNLPLYLLTWKIAPALAAGCTVVAKPSEITPMTAFLLSEICAKILPPGVLNIVHGTGSEAGSYLVQHSLIKAVSFTGSTATGRAIAQSTAGSFKKLSLEMGGKNPTIIFADANIEQALETALRSAFLNQGQICLCGSRILIEEKIYESFRNRLVERVKSLKVGSPFSPETKLGALVSAAHRDKVMSYIQIAQDEGGKILCGGHTVTLPAPFENGYYVAPTLIEGLSAHCRTNQEEIFGPIATLTPFRSEAEAIELANSTKYGLSASLWTQDHSKARRVAEALDCGMVWINCWMFRDLRTPFGGIKESGLGREGGTWALSFFSEPKTITIKGIPKDFGGTYEAGL